MKKIIMGAIVLIVLLVAAAFSYLYVNSDKIFKQAIEKYGQDIIGTKVTVTAAKLDIAAGKATINGLTIANPPGFASVPAIKVAEIAVSLDGTTLSKPPMVLHRIVVSAPEIAFETSANGSSNLQTLQEHVLATVGGQKTSDQPQTTQVEKQASNSPESDHNRPGAGKLIIDALDITGGKLTLSTPLPGVAATASLGEIHLSSLGREEGGITAPQAAEHVFNALSAASLHAVTNLTASSVINSVKDAVKSGEAVKALQGLIAK